jgi:hypothetical protein
MFCGRRGSAAGHWDKRFVCGGRRWGPLVLERPPRGCGCIPLTQQYLAKREKLSRLCPILVTVLSLTGNTVTGKLAASQTAVGTTMKRGPPADPENSAAVSLVRAGLSSSEPIRGSCAFFHGIGAGQVTARRRHSLNPSHLCSREKLNSVPFFP